MAFAPIKGRDYDIRRSASSARGIRGIKPPELHLARLYVPVPAPSLSSMPPASTDDHPNLPRASLGTYKGLSPSKQEVGMTEFEQGKLVGMLQAQRDNMLVERDRANLKAKQAKAERDSLRQELETTKADLERSKALTADLSSRLQAYGPSSRPEQVSSNPSIPAAMKLNSGYLPHPATPPVPGPRQSQRDGDRPQTTITDVNGSYMKQVLNNLFKNVEDWSARHATEMVTSMDQAPRFKSYAGKMLKQNLFDLVESCQLRKFLCAAIINTSIVPLLGGGILELLRVFSRNPELLKAKSAKVDGRLGFRNARAKFEDRCSIIRDIALQSAYVNEVEVQIKQISTKVITALSELIPSTDLASAEAEFEDLMRLAFSVALEMVLFPCAWTVSVAERGDAFDQNKMIQLDPSMGAETANNPDRSAFQVRFAVRPSIIQRGLSDAGQDIQKVMTQSVILARTTPERPNKGKESKAEPSKAKEWKD